MIRKYSIYEAKARLSEVLRHVKSGVTVVVTERGIPVAKVVPYVAEESFEERLERLRVSGQLAPRQSSTFPGVQSRPGALGRFLKDRE